VLTMNFQENTARVTVAFNLKTGETGMQLPYELERSGNKWVVKGLISNGKEPPAGLPSDHPVPGGSGGLPSGHPQVGGSAGELPSGHPQVGGSGGLPSGHPPVGSKE